MLLGWPQVLARIHRPQLGIGGNLLVERVYQAAKRWLAACLLIQARWLARHATHPSRPRGLAVLRSGGSELVVPERRRSPRVPYSAGPGPAVPWPSVPWSAAFCPAGPWPGPAGPWPAGPAAAESVGVDSAASGWRGTDTSVIPATGCSSRAVISRSRSSRVTAGLAWGAVRAVTRTSSVSGEIVSMPQTSGRPRIDVRQRGSLDMLTAARSSASLAAGTGVP